MFFIAFVSVHECCQSFFFSSKFDSHDKMMMIKRHLFDHIRQSRARGRSRCLITMPEQYCTGNGEAQGIQKVIVWNKERTPQEVDRNSIDIYKNRIKHEKIILPWIHFQDYLPLRKKNGIIVTIQPFNVWFNDEQIPAILI